MWLVVSVPTIGTSVAGLKAAVRPSAPFSASRRDVGATVDDRGIGFAAEPMPPKR
jgi:hypothetical protein